MAEDEEKDNIIQPNLAYFFPLARLDRADKGEGVRSRFAYLVAESDQVLPLKPWISWFPEVRDVVSRSPLPASTEEELKNAIHNSDPHRNSQYKRRGEGRRAEMNSRICPSGRHLRVRLSRPCSADARPRACHRSRRSAARK